VDVSWVLRVLLSEKVGEQIHAYDNAASFNHPHIGYILSGSII
jgi:hypothetical protein